MFIKSDFDLSSGIKIADSIDSNFWMSVLTLVYMRVLHLINLKMDMTILAEAQMVRSQGGKCCTLTPKFLARCWTDADNVKTRKHSDGISEHWINLSSDYYFIVLINMLKAIWKPSLILHLNTKYIKSVHPYISGAEVPGITKLHFSLWERGFVSTMFSDSLL